MPDVYTLLLLRAAGTGLLAIISFIAFIMFWFIGENSTGRLFGMVMLLISLYAVMVSLTALAVVNSHNLTPTLTDFYYSFWLRETVTVWLADLAIIILGIYLLRNDQTHH